MAAIVFNQAQLELLDMMQWVKSPKVLAELWFLSQEGTGRIRCNVGAWGNDRRKAEELWDIAQKNSLSPIVMNIVLDTNCLVIAISRQSEYHQVWQDFLAGKLIIKDHTMAALGLGGKPYKKIKVTHLIWCATFFLRRRWADHGAHGRHLHTLLLDGSAHREAEAYAKT